MSSLTRAQTSLVKAARMEAEGQYREARLTYLWLTTASPDFTINIDCDDGVSFEGHIASLASERLVLLEKRTQQFAEQSPMGQENAHNMAEADVVKDEPAAPVQPVMAVPTVAQLPDNRVESENTQLQTINQPPASRFISPPVEGVRTLTGYRVQLASYREQSQAERGWRRLKAAYPAVLDERKPHIRRAEVPQRGVFYRLSVAGFQDVGQSVALCDALITAGGECIVKEPG